MRQHFEAVEADFQREYGLDLRACLFGPRAIGARRLRSLVVGLPHDSALKRAANPQGDWRQGSVEELLATIAEQVDRTNRIMHAVHSKPQARIPRPIKINRPGAPAQQRRPARGREIMDHIGRGPVRVSRSEVS